MSVQFEQVNFSYDADKATLKNIDFSVPQNSFTAIIGTSGSGKTTLLNLLLRFGISIAEKSPWVVLIFAIWKMTN